MTLHQPIARPPGHSVRKLSVEDFLLLDRNGSFEDYAKAELLDGEIWVVNAIHSRHASVQGELQGRLWSALAAMKSGLRAYVTPSVEMDDHSLPEPDLVVAEPHSDGFLPLSKVRLVIEVSDTTLDVDLGRKQRIYAAAGIPEYWVVDVRNGVLHQMWSAVGDAYHEYRDTAFGQSIASATILGLTINTEAI